MTPSEVALLQQFDRDLAAIQPGKDANKAIAKLKRERAKWMAPPREKPGLGQGTEFGDMMGHIVVQHRDRILLGKLPAPLALIADEPDIVMVENGSTIAFTPGGQNEGILAGKSVEPVLPQDPEPTGVALDQVKAGIEKAIKRRERKGKVRSSVTGRYAKKDEGAKSPHTTTVESPPLSAKAKAHKKAGATIYDIRKKVKRAKPVRSRKR